MKRTGNLYEQICSIDNLKIADAKARKGKKKQYGIKLWDKAPDANILSLHNELTAKTYKTSPYSVFKVYEPKERDVYRLPYRDRVVHHAIMNLLEPIFTPMFTTDTYSCIKGKGIYSMFTALRLALKNKSETIYCFQGDIKKYYPSVDHDILKNIVRRKIKDNDLLSLLDSIIDSAPGIPIGNYLSQYFANLYLTPFDHYIKEQMGVKHYFRYLDDIIVLSGNKAYLHALRASIQAYFEEHLKLTLKSNYSVFPSAEGIDVIGHVFYPTHILVRKSIKQNAFRAIKKRKKPNAIAGHMGWLKHGNCKNLIKKLLCTNSATSVLTQTQ